MVYFKQMYFLVWLFRFCMPLAHHEEDSNYNKTSSSCTHQEQSAADYALATAMASCQSETIGYSIARIRSSLYYNNLFGVLKHECNFVVLYVNSHIPEIRNCKHFY